MSQGLAREGFDLDLQHGKDREQAFANIAQLSTVECKSDGKCRTTGNVFIEYRQKGRPSGIATTTADYWAIEVDDNVWVVQETERLKRLGRLALAQGRSTRGGDNNLYRGVLVPARWLVLPISKVEGSSTA